MPAGEVVDPFEGVESEVPEALADHLRGIRLVDHHVHGVFTADLGRKDFEAALNEGSNDPIPDEWTMFDSPLGVAIRRWCAPLLGLPAHATADAYWAARSELSADEAAQVLLPAAGVDRWVVDTGFSSSLITTPERLSELSGGTPSSEVLRLEVLLEELIGAGHAPGDVPALFRERLAQAAPHVVGTKSIVAYRCGFDLDWSRPDDAAVAAAVGRLAQRGTAPRVDDPVLSVFAIHEAAGAGLPVQLHVGLGDRDLDLHRVDPMLLLPLLRSMPLVPVLLLHCYPFHRQAGYLAQSFDHVSFDVGLAINYLGARSVELVAEAMELAPFAKQLYSSDAFGPPELHVLGSVLWRRAMGLVLGSWVHRGDWGLDDARIAVDLIGASNARRVYRL